MVISIAVIVLVGLRPDRAPRKERWPTGRPTRPGIVSDSWPRCPAPASTPSAAPPPPPGAVVPPTLVTGQPLLTAGGKPEVLFVGVTSARSARAERWPFIVALRGSAVSASSMNMQSAPMSVFPGIQTFTFAEASYTSPYVTLTGVELTPTAPTPDGTYTRIAALDTRAAGLVDTATGGAGCTGHPAGGRVPVRRHGKQAGDLDGGLQPRGAVAPVPGHDRRGTWPRPRGPAGQAVVAAANQLTAGICASTGQTAGFGCAPPGASGRPPPTLVPA